MQTIDPTPDAWVDCQPGELSRMVHRINDGRRRRAAGQSVLAAAVVLVAVATAWQFFPSTREYSYGEITCSEVEAGLADYVAGDLSTDRLEQFRLHLDRCPRCQDLLDQMGGTAGQPVADANLTGRLILADSSRLVYHPTTQQTERP